MGGGSIRLRSEWWEKSEDHDVVDSWPGVWDIPRMYNQICRYIF